MARETTATRTARLHAVRDVLRRTYPDAHCELVHANPLELLVATILSAQCTDRQVNVVTAGLFRKYRTAADYAAAAPEQLEQDVRRIGLFRGKARNLRAAVLRDEAPRGGAVPRTLAELTALPGVGRKTANVVLGNAFGAPAGVVVDTHVARLARRLGFTRETDPVKIEAALNRLVPAELWTMFPHWLIFHGRRRCFARRPDCAGCELRALCPSAGRPAAPES